MSSFPFLQKQISTVQSRSSLPDSLLLPEEGDTVRSWIQLSKGDHRREYLSSRPDRHRESAGTGQADPGHSTVQAGRKPLLFVIAGRLNNHECLSYGPGDLKYAHKPDEFVEIKDIERCERVLVELIYELI